MRVPVAIVPIGLGIMQIDRSADSECYGYVRLTQCRVLVNAHRRTTDDVQLRDSRDSADQVHNGNARPYG